MFIAMTGVTSLGSETDTGRPLFRGLTTLEVVLV